MVYTRKQFVVTTTGNIEGRPIEEYLGIVSAQVVAGTGLFLDVVAEFSDIFGGKSATYQRRLEAIQQEALRVLETKARALGANAIVGIRIDHDEVAGKGKQMFMVTVSGTAVIVQVSAESRENQSELLTLSDIETRSEYLIVLEDLKSGIVDFSEETLELLVSNRCYEFTEAILDALRLFALEHGSGWVDSDQYKFCVEYLMNAPDDLIEPILYSKIVHNANASQVLCQLVKDCRLINFASMLQLIKSNNTTLLQAACWMIVSGSKKLYSSQDVSVMRQIVEYAQELENSYPWTVKKTMLGGRETKVWRCSCGRSIDVEREICLTCGTDKFGLTEEARLSDVCEKLAAQIEAFESLTF